MYNDIVEGKSGKVTRVALCFLFLTGLITSITLGFTMTRAEFLLPITLCLIGFVCIFLGDSFVITSCIVFFVMVVSFQTIFLGQKNSCTQKSTYARRAHSLMGQNTTKSPTLMRRNTAEKYVLIRNNTTGRGVVATSIMDNLADSILGIGHAIAKSDDLDTLHHDCDLSTIDFDNSLEDVYGKLGHLWTAVEELDAQECRQDNISCLLKKEAGFDKLVKSTNDTLVAVNYAVNYIDTDPGVDCSFTLQDTLISMELYLRYSYQRVRRSSLSLARAKN